MADSEVLDVAIDDLGSVKKNCFEDINFFSDLALPDVMVEPFPLYYVALWLNLKKAIEENNQYAIKKILRYVIGLPRGFCKTTFLKILIAWLVCHRYVHFVLVICATDPLAEAFLNDLDNILKSQNIERLYGKWDPVRDAADTKRGAHSGRMLIIKARGAGTAVRGINEDNKRPDFILCDDMQTKENDESETDRIRLFNWFVGTLLKTVTQKKAIVVYVGNMYSDHCILYLLKNNPHWISLITGCILESGESLWPALYDIEDLYESFIHDESLGKADIWFAEMMNDPVESSNSLLKGPFPLYNREVIPFPDASWITVDPAGYRKASDDNVIAAHYMIDAKNFIAEMDGGIWNPEQTVKNGLAMALRHEAGLIAVEAVAYQQTLVYWFKHFMTKLQIAGIEVVELKRPNNITKERFIRNFIAEIYAGNYYFLRDVDRVKFVWQATAFRIGKKDNKDDWLDCPAMGLEVRNQFASLLKTRKIIAVQGIPARVVGNNTPF